MEDITKLYNYGIAVEIAKEAGISEDNPEYKNILKVIIGLLDELDDMENRYIEASDKICG